MRIKPIAAGAALATAGGIAFTSVVRPWYSRWGATDAEIDRPMPLDERIPDPTITTTMAITINTRPEAIWPWLVQMGAGRGGFYSYDWLERGAGLGIRSADRILPELQRLKVGDVVPLSPDGGIPVRLIRSGAALGLGGTIDLRTGRMSPAGVRPIGRRLDVGWTFVLRPAGPQATRLLSRTRYDFSPLAEGLALRALLEPVQFLMERRMLLGIRSRAEGRRS